MTPVDQMCIRDVQGDGPRRLLCHILGVSRLWCVQNPDFLVTFQQQQDFLFLKQRLNQGEPISKIIGLRSFWRDDFITNAHVLDPRPDSETLIQAVLNRFSDRDAPYRILDLGVGSGCLLLSLLGEYPRARGVGVDRSWAALQVARQNAQRLGHDPLWVQGSWGDAVAGRFDIILSNPPYIPTTEIADLEATVRDFDPLMALDGGGDGLDCYRALMPRLRDVLAPSGMAFLEIGWNQAPFLRDLAQKNALSVVSVEKDLENRDRCVIVGL